ncbi:unnamed protein product, partial [Iphiclides podalirius]
MPMAAFQVQERSGSIQVQGLQPLRPPPRHPTPSRSARQRRDVSAPFMPAAIDTPTNLNPMARNKRYSGNTQREEQS